MADATEANETARMRLGEIYTAARLLVENIKGHHALNVPINPNRVQMFADKCDSLAGELRELADSMPDDDPPLNGLLAAIGVDEPLTTRPGEYMGISRRCPTCDSPSPERHPAMQFEGEVQECRDPWHTRDRCPVCHSPKRDMRAVVIVYGETSPCENAWHCPLPVEGITS